MDEQYKYIVNTYPNGYYIYSFVINFKPGSTYDDIHPKKAHALFKSTFTKYFKRHPNFAYIIFPELSQQGKYHIHGLLFHKEGDYDLHDKTMRLINNHFRRKYGWVGTQRIYSLLEPYNTNDIRFMRKTRSTTFSKIWHYITKDYLKFPFLDVFYKHHQVINITNV